MGTSASNPRQCEVSCDRFSGFQKVCDAMYYCYWDRHVCKPIHTEDDVLEVRDKPACGKKDFLEDCFENPMCDFVYLLPGYEDRCQVRCDLFEGEEVCRDEYYCQWNREEKACEKLRQ